MVETRQKAERQSASLAFLDGGGEMGALMRSHDWSGSPLGPPEDWPQPLRTAIRLLLNTGHPMYIWWGPELLCFYNDAYRRSIGPERHPCSLGRPAREVWAEIWDIIGPADRAGHERGRRHLAGRRPGPDHPERPARGGLLDL